MRAVHPQTGKPITILKTETQLTKTNRTLLWHISTLVNSPRWQRWSILVTDPKSLKTQPKPEIVFIYSIDSEEDHVLWKTWLETFTSETLLICTPKTLEALSLTTDSYESLLSTADFEHRYPHLPTLKEASPINEWVVNITKLMRFHKLVSPFEIQNDSKFQVVNISQTANAEQVVPPVYLIQQYFESPMPKRQQELDRVLRENIKCDYVDKIVLLNEKSYTLPKSDKLEQHVIGKRLTYLDVMLHIKNSVPRDVYVIFANSDIYFDSTLCALYSLEMEKKFLSLLRYDVSPNPNSEPKLFGPRPDSQDAWILLSSSVDFEPTEEDFGFSFGISGCDNAVNVSMLRKRFIVANPALTIKTYHVHNSNVRTYVRSAVVDKPTFLYLTPTAIQEYQPVSDLTSYTVKSWQRKPLRSFTRQIKYVDKIVSQTICNMLSKCSDYDFGVDSANTYNQGFEPCDNVLYKFDDAYALPSGLVCTNKDMFIGTHPKWKVDWTNATVTVLTNTIELPEFIAAPFPTENAQSTALWFLHYLPKILTVRKHLDKKPEFLCPDHPDLNKALSLLRWPESGEIKMSPYLEDVQIHSQTVYCLSPNSSNEVTAESIASLRSLLPTCEPNSVPKVVIAVERDPNAIFTAAWANELIKNVFSRGNWDPVILDFDTPTEKRLRSIMEADLFIAPSVSEWEALRWAWLQKPATSVIELMEDTKPVGEHIHLAGAANLNYILVGVKREPLPFQRQHALEDIQKCCSQHVFQATYKAQVPQSQIPKLILPSGKALTNIHTHVGDTFREMVYIWEQRGYCTVEKRDDTPFVWWGQIGDVLLYDRPTLRWFQSSVPSYKLALYGNTFPENPTKLDSLWSFWPRSPKAVENASVLSSNTYERRKTKSIFIGRIENGIQKEKRTTHDWSKSVTLFHMPIDSTGGPYKYSQTQYLQELSNAKFGLALPGFGPKCNREIEYFAMGTVPIITPGVDMTHYKLPPLENIHYFTANSPEQVKQIVENTSSEKWAEMSIAGRAWWRKYASAEGLFRLTWGIINESIIRGM